MQSSRLWVWVFDDRNGLDWVLSHQMMVFPTRAPRRSREIREGDRALAYLTRGSSSADGPSHIEGLFRATGDVRRVDEILIDGIPGRSFSWAVPIEAELLAAPGQGPRLTDYVEDLDLVENPRIWGQYFRTSPIELSVQDFNLLERSLREYIESDRESI